MAKDEAPRQLGLFGDRRERVVDGAHVPEELAAVAAGIPARVRFGTSSWAFPGWRGLVYDRAAKQQDLARHGLEAYAQHPLLRAVGVDRTFYAPIPAEDFATYAKAVPAEFRFLVKAASHCTARQVRGDGGTWHDNPGFLDAGFAADEVVAPFVAGLGVKAGPLVFQFPPQATAHPKSFARELGAFFAALPEGPTYAVELRDSALLTDDYVAALAAHGVSHCVSLHPRMPALARQRELREKLGGPLVVRWMLRRGLGYEQARERYAPFERIQDPDVDNRRELAELCRDVGREHDVFVIANNKAEGCAPQTVFELARAMV